ncbi:hypothetical protein FHR34_007390 [Kitasatospora kifunensis]|uniref:Uncharacterized protein n=1 Tax=Kitasatospora kifunensis TaxID=58351 RepID=A0A7W7RAI5_KITKI|nr:hypothetical protein [Kitasatospora kifunensis]
MTGTIACSSSATRTDWVCLQTGGGFVAGHIPRQ